MKKLYRLEKNKLIAGICAGIADAYNLDPTVVRLAAVFLTILTAFWPGVITYLVAWYLLPEKSELTDSTKKEEVQS
jgi:phage shock protein PspC (stress-responsive transcriptional regulator)